MNLYINICLFIILLILVFGVVGPYLVSAPHTEFVLTGFLLIVLSLPIFYKLASSIYKDIRRYLNHD